MLIAITGENGDGIAVVDLSSIQEPPALPYVSDRGGKNQVHGVLRSRLQAEGYKQAPGSIAMRTRVRHVTKVVSPIH